MRIKYVMEEEWDFLIILDACRYDYFKKVYREYFNKKKKKKAISPATWTLEWVEKNFKKYYDDIIYVSSVAFINSKKPISWHKSYFFGKEHFYKVVDAWDFGWDEKLRVVPPERVNQIALNTLKENPGKKIIIHYFQPHSPFLSLVDLNKKWTPKKRKIKFEKENDTVRERVKLFTAEVLTKIGGTKLIWKLNKKLNIQQPGYMEFVWREIGDEGLREAYTKNLLRVLRCTSDLIKKLQGKIIITSDHGELLGEDGLYGHGLPLPPHPKLIEIPWFTVVRK